MYRKMLKFQDLVPYIKKFSHLEGQYSNAYHSSIQMVITMFKIDYTGFAAAMSVA